MKLRSVSIKNFRKIEDISFSLDRDIAALVGPNAVGKSTVFEAIRLAKAILAHRTPDEAAQVLINLGASTPNILFGPFSYDYSALAGDPTIPIDIRLQFDLAVSEVTALERNVDVITQHLAATRIGRNIDQARLELIQYFSTIPGQQNLAQSRTDVMQRIAILNTSPKMEFSLSINALQMSGQNAVDQIFLATLERSVAPFRALFSYFPADRAMPAGEINVQLGSGDMKAQVDSHVAAPSNKFARLKQVILNELVLNGFDKAAVTALFNDIFRYFLPGKSLAGFEQRPTGQLRVNVFDKASGRTFDVDALSSGEKGLILTFVLLRTGLERGGIALLDEPELHLHPSLCNRILPFLIESAENNDLQILFTTHSPDLLRRVLDSDKCQAFHLRSSSTISPMFTSDRRESLDALKRLGVSAAESFLSRAHVFVEGEDDKDILESGFAEALLNCSVSGLGGRGEVEKYVRQLQKAEPSGEVDRINLFIFDHDRRTTDLPSTPFVRIEQLERYCIENYLIDSELLLIVIRRIRKPGLPEITIGDLNAILDRAWKQQLRELVLREAYGDLQKINCAIDLGDVRFKEFSQVGAFLLAGLSETKERLSQVISSTWLESFLTACESIYQSRLALWTDNWLVLASGKQIFEDIQKAFQVGPLSRVKVEVVREMQIRRTSDWQYLNKKLSDHLVPPTAI